MTSRRDRGQAFTLEGIGSAVILLSALLFSLQAMVINPGSGGETNPAEQQELDRLAEDVLITSARAETRDLSWLVRHWSSSQQRFEGALNRQEGYGANPPPGALGSVIEQTAGNDNLLYNVEMKYLTTDGSGFETTTIARHGRPGADAAVATYTITLYDHQLLTAGGASPNLNLSEYDETADPTAPSYPVPDAIAGPIYNVVEVRVIVW